LEKNTSHFFIKYIIVVLCYFCTYPIFSEWVVEENNEYQISNKNYEIPIIEVNDTLNSKDINDHIIYFEDEQNKAVFKDALLSQNLKEFRFSEKQTPNFGYSSHTYWGYMRFKFHPSYNNDIILMLDYSLIDRIQLECIDQNKSLYVQILGDQVSIENWKINFRKPSFTIRGNTRECWFRSKSTSSNQYSFLLNSSDAFQNIRVSDTFLQSLYFGGVISILLYNLFMSIATKSGLYLLYSFFLLSNGLFQASFSGISFLYLWSNAPLWWINKSSIILLSALGLTSYLFISNILDTEKKHKNLYKISMFFVFIHFIHITLSPFLSYKISIFFVYFLIPPWVLFITLTTWYLSMKKNRVALFLFGSWIIFLIGILFTVLQLLGFINSNFFTKNGQQIGSMLEFILLSITMGYRIKETQELSALELKHTIQEKNILLKQEKERRDKQIELLQALENEKENAKKAYLKLEASQNELMKSDRMITLGSMVAGVAHEINTPLGAIKANSENILFTFNELLTILNPINTKISPDDWKKILSYIELSKESNNLFSTKEIRAKKKVVQGLLQESNIQNSELVAEDIVDLGLSENLDDLKLDFGLENFSELIRACKILKGIQKKANVINLSSDRVSKIVKSLKSFMHFEESEEMVASNLKENMETVLTILNNKLKNSIEVIKHYDPIPSIYCFPDELNQIWTNLIHNSIQAMQGNGIIQIEIKLVGTPDLNNLQSPIPITYKQEEENIEKYSYSQYISITIEDNGPGIPPEIQKKIFEPFFTTKKAGEGSGLGLHIIQKILSKHRGYLELHSIPARTRFTIYLPARLYKIQ
jgi:signal transduction histidine kinase